MTSVDIVISEMIGSPHNPNDGRYSISFRLAAGGFGEFRLDSSAAYSDRPKDVYNALIAAANTFMLPFGFEVTSASEVVILGSLLNY